MSLRIGAVGVQKVSAKLLENGFLVSLPIFDEGYDMISDWKGRLQRVQVKSTGGQKNMENRTKLKFLAARGPGYIPSSNKHGVKETYGKSDCDAFIFYHIPLDALFVVPRIRLPKTKSIYLPPNSLWRDNWDVLRNFKKG
jgi:hypothetical protein